MVKLKQDSANFDKGVGRETLAADTAWDFDGVPQVRPVEDWLELVSQAVGDGRSGRLQALLRFRRPDGSTVFGPRGKSPASLKILRELAILAADPSLARVVDGWSPNAALRALGSTSPLPAPSDSRPDRVLAVLRPDWTTRGDLLAIDHRSPGSRSLVEVTARGQTWLGPGWTSNAVVDRDLAKPTQWSSTPFVDAFEWSVGRSTRTAVLLRGKNLAILAEQAEGSGPTIEVRLAIPEGVEAMPDPVTRSVILSPGKGKPTARIIPIGLSSTPYPTEKGSIAIEGREVVIRQSSPGRRRWLPVLICWDKPPTSWRTLTVGAQSKSCPADLAFAARVSWGSGQGLLIYRSLAPADLRTFLGFQTRSRFFVGSYDASGDVRPILKVDPAPG